MTTTATIWHNPRCSKSRQTLALLQEKLGEDAIEIVLYLKTPPTAAQLKTLQQQLAVDAHDMVRPKEQAYNDAGLRPGSDEDALFEAIVETPKLLERPIVQINGQARIGRPPEKVLELLK